MSRLQKCWGWLGSSKNQKTLAFVGSGLAIIAGAFWQIYPHFFGAQESKSSNAHSSITVNAPVNSPVINQPSAAIEIKYGIPPEEFQRLAEELGVRKIALEKFFEILEQAQVAPKDLDSSPFKVIQSIV